MEQQQILQEIRDDVRAVRSELTGVLVQVASLSEWRKSIERADDEQEHEQRIRRLEEGKAWLLGAAAVLGALAGLLTKLVVR